MLARILQNLNIYLGDDYNQQLMTLIVNNVISQIKLCRNYPDDYTEEMITTDLEKYETKIFNIAVVVFNRMGIEGESMHDENLTKSNLVGDDKLYDFIVPIARCV